MLVYLVRRLIAAVILLLVVTAATFAIFFLVPRLAGATPEGLASRYVGRTADEATMRAIAERLGFLDPVYVQYLRFLRQLVFGADFSTGPTTVHCPAPCLGYSFLRWMSCHRSSRCCLSPRSHRDLLRYWDLIRPRSVAPRQGSF